MVKHTHIADELCESVRPFCGIGAERVNYFRKKGPLQISCRVLDTFSGSLHGKFQVGLGKPIYYIAFRAVFRTQLNIYDEGFWRKYLTAFSR